MEDFGSCEELAHVHLQYIDKPKFTSGNILEWKEIYEQIQAPIVLPVAINLHLIRHAQSKTNADKRVTGAQDVALSLEGEQQAIALGKDLLSSYDVIFASTLQRSQATLELAVNSRCIKVEQVFVDSRLNERCLGILEGQPWHWIPEYANGDLSYSPEGGESYEEVARRILSFLIELANYTLKDSIRNVLISGHMGPMRIMMGILEEKEEATTVLNATFSNTEVIKLSWRRLVIPGFLRL